MILAAVVMQMEAIELPHSPSCGIAVARDGTFYLGEPGESDADGSIGKYSLTSGKLTRTGTFAKSFGNELDIDLQQDGVIVADYTLAKLSRYTYKGEHLWSTPLISAHVMKSAPDGNLWFISEGGSIRLKTKDSSAIEPLLDANGSETFIAGAFDIVPETKLSYYLLRHDGRIEHRTQDALPTLLTTIFPIQRMILSKLGGLVAFENSKEKQSITHIASDGKTKTLWTAPPGFPLMKHFSRTGDGNILIAGDTEKGGIAYIFDPEKQK